MKFRREAPAAGDSAAATTRAERPTLATVFPEWKELSDHVSALAWRRDEVLAEVAEINRVTASNDGLLQSYAPDRTARNVETPAPAPKPIRQSIMEKLGRFAPPQPSAPDPNAPKPEPKVTYHDPHQARKVELAKELADIDDALAILQPQLQRARAEGSKLLAAATADDYRQVATEVITAAISLADAVHRHRELLADVQRQGAEPAFLRPIDAAGALGVLSDPRANPNPLRAMIAWAMSNGHYDGSIPDWWNEPVPEPPPPPKRPEPATVHRPKLVHTARGSIFLPAFSERDTATKAKVEQILADVRRRRAAPPTDAGVATIEPGI